MEEPTQQARAKDAGAARKKQELIAEGRLENTN